MTTERKRTGMSVFAERLAQVREALRDYRDAGSRPGMYVAGQDALAALDLIEQRAAEMETALRQIAAYEVGPAAAIARAAFSAREETDKDSSR